MPDMIVASTTATQEEMDHAVSPNWREPFQAKVEPKPEVKVEPTEPAETEEEATETPEASEETETATVPEAEEEQEPEQRPKGKGGFQKKIDKLTREKGEASARALALEDELRELKERMAKPAVAEEKPKVETKGKPTADEIGTKYKDYDEFNEALIDWKTEKLLQTTLETRDREARERETREIQETRDTNYREAAKEFAEQTPDFNEAVVNATKSGMKLPEPIIELIKELPNGPAVTYYLVTNPETSLELLSASPAMGFAMIGRISQGFEAQPEPVKAPAKKPISSAPPPAKPVSGNSARSSTPLSEMTTDEFIRSRNQQERDRRRYP